MSAAEASSPTQQVVAELLSVVPPAEAAGRAETAAALRVGGGARGERGRMFLDATLPSAAVARRLADMMVDLYGCQPPAIRTLSGGRASVRQRDAAEAIAKRAGLIDIRGRPAEGMPAALVAAATARFEIAAAAMRGAVLASGRILGQPGSLTLRVRCDCLALAMAVAGFTRRLGADAILRERRGGIETACSVMVRDISGLHSLLVAIGASQSAADLVGGGTVTPQSSYSGRLQMANKSRAVAAAQGVTDRLTQAVSVMGSELSDELSDTAALRLAHPEASLAELGRLSDPPVSKNVIAGRLRQLLRVADRHQTPPGVPA